MKTVVFDDVIKAIPDDLMHLVPGFLNRREKEIPELLNFLRRNDFAAIKDIAHKIKGTGTGYGFVGISDLGSRMEKAAAEHDEAETRRSIEQLAALTARLQQALHRQKTPA